MFVRGRMSVRMPLVLVLFMLVFTNELSDGRQIDTHTDRGTGNIGYFWHVTDFHLDHTYWGAGLSCNEPITDKGQFGDYWCDSPWSLVNSSIAAMAGVRRDVDFLIWTGDTVAHIKNQHLNLTTNLGIMQNLTDALTSAFPNVSVYASLGNHDFFPSDQAQVSSALSEMYEKVAAMWQHWIGEDQAEAFKKGGYYLSQVQPGIQVISLNTNLYYDNNQVTQNLTDPAGQLVWLDAALDRARAEKQAVIITGHVPVGLLSPGLTQWFHPQYIEPFLDVIHRHSDVISALHFGHNHGDGFVVLQEKENSAKAVAQFMAPSVTPWRYKIPTKSGAAHNPGVRLVKYDRATGQQLDFDQYFINLTDSNSRGRTKWEKLYTFTLAYSVPDMSVTSLRSVLTSMSSLDSPEGRRFCRHHLVSRHDKPCTPEMQAEISCAGSHAHLTDARRCIQRLVELHQASGSDGSTRQSGQAVCVLAVCWLCTWVIQIWLTHD